MARMLGREDASPRVLGIFQGGGAGGPHFRFRDVGDDPLHGKGHGGVSAQSRQADYGETAGSTGGWELGAPTSGDSVGGIGV